MTQRIIPALDALLKRDGDAVGRWFIEAFKATPPPLTSSVDLRHSGQRLVPVDTNIYPAGWNKISDSAKRRAGQYFKRRLSGQMDGVKRVLLVPENHTRNQGYLTNLISLRDIIAGAGYELRLGRAVDGEHEAVDITLDDGRSLHAEALTRDGAVLRTADGFEPDVVILNNDLTDGLPALLDGIAQPVLPPSAMGWHRRLKSEHFQAYDAVVEEFAAAFGLDGWRVNARWRHCGAINFREREGMDCIARAIDELIGLVRPKHREYALNYEPYVFIKADAGTYGMGVMTARSSDEVYNLNKKRRHSMNAIKSGVGNTRVLVQEGVPTADLIAGGAAEPVIYLINGDPVGGFYRVHNDKGEYESLNSVGSDFAAMCEEVEEPEIEPSGEFGSEPCNFRVFGAVARLATLAAAREMARAGKARAQSAEAA